MAHIQINGSFPQQMVINGVDVSREVFRDYELVSVGDDEFAQVGLRVTFAVSRLDLDAEADVKVTDNLPEVAQRVRSMSEGDDAPVHVDEVESELDILREIRRVVVRMRADSSRKDRAVASALNSSARSNRRDR